uniref:T-cell surface glycoprotein CD8 alpha chain n=1 Tax=Semicossyphus pulcher TaxID=241346 RepID=UPI0037E75A8F
MDQKWILILMILVFYQKITTGAAENIKDGQRVEIKCNPTEKGTTVIWFRVLSSPGIEFIASFDFKGAPKTSLAPIFSHEKSAQFILILKSFNKDRDSGFYSCVSQKSSEVKFGQVTQLAGEKVEVATKAPLRTTTATPCTTAAPCVCGHNIEQGETSLLLLCSPVILGPLVGGCGFLLLLLVVTTLYCNKIRTRRCPHHYNRKPRAMPLGKQITNRRA